MNNNDDVANNSTDYLKRKVNREVRNKSYQVVHGSIDNLKEKRKVRVHRKHIDNIQKFDDEININKQNNNYSSNLDNKIEKNEYKINEVNTDRNKFLDKREDILNKNPNLHTSLGYVKRNEINKNSNQKEYNKAKMRNKYKFKERDLDNDGVSDRIDIDDTRNSVQTTADLDKVGNRTDKSRQKDINQKKMSQKYNFQDKKQSFQFEDDFENKDILKDKNKAQKKNNRKKSMFGNPLTSNYVGQRKRTQKVMLAPTKAVSGIGASLKESVNKEIENSDMEGIQLANNITSPIARKLRFKTNDLISKKLGFDRKAYNLSKIEKKIIKADKKAFKVKKAQRKNIRKKAKIKAKKVGGKIDLVERIKSISSKSANQIKKKIISTFKEAMNMIRSSKFLASASGVLLVVLVPFLLLAPVFIIGGGTAVSNAENQQSDFSFSASSLDPEVRKWEDVLFDELKKHNLEKYLDLGLVIIQLESGGKLPDIMQSSESAGFAPNTITDERESIKYGVLHLKKAVKKKQEYNVDFQTLIQSYNYGINFIPYVANNGGKWTQKIANDYSDYQAERLGWSSYGDKKYLEKAMKYLTIEGEDIFLGGNFDLEGKKLAFPVPNYSAVSSSYGWRIHPIYGTRKFHTGTDIPAPTGTPVVASADGKVIEAGSKGGYGNAVMIDHGSGVVTLYAHNSSLNVTAGQTVKVGQVIAKVGSTGQSTGPHSHFEVRLNGEYTDPLEWLN